MRNFLFLLLFGIQSIAISQNCELKKDTIIYCSFLLDYNNTREPVYGMGYINQLESINNFSFSNDRDFIESFCSNTFLKSDDLINLSRVLNKCFKDSSIIFKRQMTSNMIQSNKQLFRKTQSVEVEFNNMKVKLYFRKVFVEYITESLSRDFEINYATEGNVFKCKSKDIDSIIRVLSILEVIDFSEEELLLINSLGKD